MLSPRVQSVVFTPTSNFDLENSCGQTWPTGDVFGWYSLGSNPNLSNGVDAHGLYRKVGFTQLSRPERIMEELLTDAYGAGR
jgi:hypothetical protein